MSKKHLSTLIILGALVSNAQANLTIPNTHESSNPNKIETYFIKANSTGNVPIFIASQASPQDPTFYFNGLLSVWVLIGNNWSLVGANDDAERIMSGATPGSTSIYGTPVLDWLRNGGSQNPTGGWADPGLTLNLTANSTYMIVQSEYQNGPNSLNKTGQLGVNNSSGFTGALGQTIAVGTDYSSAFWGLDDLSGTGQAYSGIFNNYVLSINGDVTAVPVPGAVWLFGTAIAGLGVMKRKQRQSGFVA